MGKENNMYTLYYTNSHRDRERERESTKMSKNGDKGGLLKKMVLNKII